MLKYMKKREEFFNKEIGNLKKKEQTLVKRLEKLDPPVQPAPILKDEGKGRDRKGKSKGKDAKSKSKSPPKKSKEKKKTKE